MSGQAKRSRTTVHDRDRRGGEDMARRHDGAAAKPVTADSGFEMKCHDEARLARAGRRTGSR
jgi:hypothetical protein